MIDDKLARHYQADALPLGHPVREAIDELRLLRADAARYRILADRMVHVSHPAGAGWTLDEVLVSGDRDLDETVDALLKQQICAVAKNIQIPEAARWIACSEQMPDDDIQVLVWATGQLFSDGNCWIASRAGDWFVDEDGRTVSGVTAWMDLPGEPEC